MRYNWYKVRWPRDRFLGQWGKYDLYRDDEDDVLAIVFDTDEDSVESVEVCFWDELQDHVGNEEHREALRQAHRLWKTPDPSVSPHSLTK